MQIIKFRAAIATNALGAEFGFCHVSYLLLEVITGLRSHRASTIHRLLKHRVGPTNRRPGAAEGDLDICRNLQKPMLHSALERVII
jgi:hypothetical protein